jgi:YD repeat-containing protein
MDFIVPKHTASEFERASFDALINAQRVTEYPSTLQQRASYSGTNFSPEYLGFNSRGEATSSNSWLIQKFTYDTSGRMTSRVSATGSWDNRTSLIYS